MTPLFKHKNPKSNFGNFIVALAEELNIEIKSAGSTTLKRRIANRGIEPTVRGNQALALETDPLPDLAIEIDITSSSVNKLRIYSALVYLNCDDRRDLKFYQLTEGQYVECEFSIAFPLVSVNEISGFIEQSKTSGGIALMKLFRAWVRSKIVQIDSNLC